MQGPPLAFGLQHGPKIQPHHRLRLPRFEVDGRLPHMPTVSSLRLARQRWAKAAGYSNLTGRKLRTAPCKARLDRTDERRQTQQPQGPAAAHRAEVVCLGREQTNFWRLPVNDGRPLYKHGIRLKTPSSACNKSQYVSQTADSLCSDALPETRYSTPSPSSSATSSAVAAMRLAAAFSRDRTPSAAPASHQRSRSRSESTLRQGGLRDTARLMTYNEPRRCIRRYLRIL